MKLALLALLATFSASAQITCSTATSAAPCSVATGGTVTLTAGSSVTWTLAPGAVGTLSGTNPATSIIYHAPTSVAPTRTLFGCQVMPMDSIFNTRVDGLPADPNSTLKINNQNGGSGTPYLSYVAFEPSRGISYMDATNAVVSNQVSFFPDNGSYPNWPTPTNQFWHREGGRYVGLTAGFAKSNSTAVDFHTMAVQAIPSNSSPADCTFYESYEQLLNGAKSQCQSNQPFGPHNCTMESLASYPSASYLPLPYGTGAAGTPAMVQQTTPDEMHNGFIPHRQRITLPGRFLSNTYRWPATATAGGGLACDGGAGSGNTTNCVQLGDVYRLKASVLSSYIASTCTGQTYVTECTAMLTAWRNYGLMVDDTGSPAQAVITPSTDCSEDSLCTATLNAIQAAAIPLSSTNFEIVDQAPLMPASCSGYATVPNGLYGCNGTYGGNAYAGEQNNNYVSPNQLAVVCAGTCGGSTAQVSVAIQPVAIGVPMPSFFGIEAGSYSWIIPYYVTGTTTKTATWAISGCSLGTGNCGSIAGAVYTPPTSLMTGTIGSFSLTGTATADSASTIILRPTIIPAPSNISRIDLGSTSDTGPDGNGNYWTRDIGSFGSTSTFQASPTYSTADPLYQQLSTTNIVGGSNGGEDFHFYEVVPNGNYAVTVYETNPQCSNGACGTWPGSRDIFELTPLLINVNGITVANAWDWSYPSGYVYAKNGNITVPATVTNNFLDVGVYPVAPDVPYANTGSQLCFSCTSPYTGTNLGTSTGNKLQFIAALQIAPSAASASLSIDAGLNSTLNLQVAPGGSSQPFYAVRNYFTGGTTTWSASGAVCGALGCTLASDALSDGGMVLTLGSGSAIAGQPILITATNGSYSGSLTLYTSGSAGLVIF